MRAGISGTLRRKASRAGTKVVVAGTSKNGTFSPRSKRWSDEQAHAAPLLEFAHHGRGRPRRPRRSRSRGHARQPVINARSQDWTAGDRPRVSGMPERTAAIGGRFQLARCGATKIPGRPLSLHVVGRRQDRRTARDPRAGSQMRSRQVYSASTRPSVPQTRGAVGLDAVPATIWGRRWRRLVRTCCCLRRCGPTSRAEALAASRGRVDRFAGAQRRAIIAPSMSPSIRHTRSRRPGNRSIRRLSRLMKCRCGTEGVVLRLAPCLAEAGLWIGSTQPLRRHQEGSSATRHEHR